MLGRNAFSNNIAFGNNANEPVLHVFAFTKHLGFRILTQAPTGIMPRKANYRTHFTDGKLKVTEHAWVAPASSSHYQVQAEVHAFYPYWALLPSSVKGAS